MGKGLDDLILLISKFSNFHILNAISNKEQGILNVEVKDHESTKLHIHFEIGSFPNFQIIAFPNTPKRAQTCPNMPKLTQTRLFMPF